MNSPPPSNAAFRSFLAFLAGIIAADMGSAGDVILTAVAVLCLAAVMIRMWTPSLPGLPAGVPRNGVFQFVLLVVVFASGAARLDVARNDTWAFSGAGGSGVNAVVVVGSMLRRDPGEVAALATVTGPDAVSTRDRGRRTVLRCFPDVREGAGSCDEIVSGATLAVSGMAGFMPDGRSVLFVNGRGGPLRLHPSGRGGSPLEWVDRVRARLTGVARQSFEGSSAWMVPAIVLGEGRGVPAADRRALSALGTAHVLSVSGLHVVAAAAFCGMLAALVIGIPASLMRQRVNLARIAAIASVGAAWAVSLLAGSPPPAVRAAGMATVLVVSTFMRRRVPVESVIALTGLLGLLINPEDGLSISFQLSYSAVFGIAIAMRATRLALRRADRRIPAGRFPPVAAAIRKTMLTSLSMSVGASLATMPLTVIYFGSAPLVSPLANLLVVPAFTFYVFPGAVASLVLASLTHSCRPGGGLCGSVIGLWGDGVNVIMDIQAGAARVLPDWLVSPSYPFDALLAAGSVFVLLVLLPGGRSRRVGLAVLAALAVFASGHWSPAPSPGVTFMDVGKGDAALIRCPSGENWLVDTGPPPRSTDRLIAALARARVQHIDGIVVTHAHDDHYGGLESAIDAFGGFELVGSARTVASLGDMPGRVVKAGGAVREVAAGASLLPGCGVESPVLKAPAGTGGSENDASLVFRLGAPGSGILFVGDLEATGESGLLASGADLSAAILKVGHHGSSGASSPEFIDAVGPELSVVTGWPNGPRLGPGDDVLWRFVQSKSRVMSTVMLGDVSVDLVLPRGTKDASSPAFKPRTIFPRINLYENDLLHGLIQKVKTGSGPHRD